jgi:hypothetical protein
MIKRNKYRKIPPNPNKKKRERRSRPLKRSVHINGKRWGWEYFANYDDGVWENERIMILSPDNKYFEIGVESFTEDFKVPDYYNTKYEVTESGTVKRYVPEKTIALQRIKPSMVKQHILDNLLIGM